MWNIDELEKIGLEFEPSLNNFTYCFPPSQFAKINGIDTKPWFLSSEPKNNQTFSLYIHIPYCEIDCSFCSLHRIVLKNNEFLIEYVEALKREIAEIAKIYGRNFINSIYIGGGTPSILEPEKIIEIFAYIKKYFTVIENAEICMEIAPSINRSLDDWIVYLKKLQSNSILPLTRISIGVQSFDEFSLKKMGRNGGLNAIESLLLAISPIIDNYNIDLILGFHETQSDKSSQDYVATILENLKFFWNKDITTPSISLYQLWDPSSIRINNDSRMTLPIKTEMIKSKWTLQNFLLNNGYFPGVVSSLIKDQAYINNWMYERHTKFNNIGIGSGSYSILPDSFIYRERNIKGYICHFLYQEDSIVDKIYFLNSSELELRGFIMGLRTFEWISGPVFKNIDESFRTDLSIKIENLMRTGLLLENNGKFKLINEAFLISNEISTYLHPNTHPRKF